MVQDVGSCSIRKDHIFEMFSFIINTFVDFYLHQPPCGPNSAPEMELKTFMSGLKKGKINGRVNISIMLLCTYIAYY